MRWLTLILASFAASFASADDECCDMWQGFYLCGQLGGAWNDSDLKFVNPNYFNTIGPQVVGRHFAFDPSGFLGGGAIGFNYQYAMFVVGLEVGAQYTDSKQSRKSPFFPDLDTFSYEIKWKADVKGRLGWAYRQFLLFFTGGWAGSPIELTLNDPGAQIQATLKEWVNGWLVGGGLEYKFFRHFSVGLEYDYIFQKFTGERSSCPSCGTGAGFGTPTIDDRLHTNALFARISFHL